MLGTARFVIRQTPVADESSTGSEEAPRGARGGWARRTSFGKIRTPVLLAGVMTALLAVGCGSGSIRPSISPERSRSTRSQPPAEPSWFRYQRPAGYGVAVENVRVPARDGTSLACALFRPARGGRPAPGRFPVVLSELFPYYGQYLKPTDNAEATYFAARGYADLVCSTRGTYNSTGRFAGWFTPIDITDDYDVIEWAAKQPWSTGRVGQEGGSYGGINALR